MSHTQRRTHVYRIPKQKPVALYPIYSYFDGVVDLFALFLAIFVVNSLGMQCGFRSMLPSSCTAAISNHSTQHIHPAANPTGTATTTTATTTTAPAPAPTKSMLWPWISLCTSQSMLQWCRSTWQPICISCPGKMNSMIFQCNNLYAPYRKK